MFPSPSLGRLAPCWRGPRTASPVARVCIVIPSESWKAARRVRNSEPCRGLSRRSKPAASNSRAAASIQKLQKGVFRRQNAGARAFIPADCGTDGSSEVDGRPEFASARLISVHDLAPPLAPLSRRDGPRSVPVGQSRGLVRWDIRDKLDIRDARDKWQARRKSDPRLKEMKGGRRWRDLANGSGWKTD